MLSSLTWGTWDSQIVPNSNVETETCFNSTTKSRKEQRRLETHAANEEPLFARLLEKLTVDAPQCVPCYNINMLSPCSNNFSWEEVSKPSQPEAGGLDPTRAERKTQQINNLLSEACFIIENRLLQTPGDVRVIEFCGGAGYVAIPLADFYRNEPRVQVTLLDMKEQSLEIAQERVSAAGLTNIVIKRERLEDFDYSPFQLGIALHACGAATDLALECCLAVGAAYVMSPCCVGKLRVNKKKRVVHSSRLRCYGEDDRQVAEGPSDPSMIHYPRSKLISSVLNTTEWSSVASAADFGHRDYVDYDVSQRKRRIAKCFVEYDRQLRSEEFDYLTHCSVMTPRTASPKNDVIAGWPRGWHIGGTSEFRSAKTSPDLQQLEAFLFSSQLNHE